MSNIPASDLDLCNAALTRCGTQTIASFDDGTTEGVILAQNYEQVVSDCLSESRWKFARSVRALNRLSGAAPAPWTAVYQCPADALEVEGVTVSGAPIEHERAADKLLCNADPDAEVIATILSRPDTAAWPPQFREFVILRLCAVLLPALGDKFQEGAQAARMADIKGRRASLRSAQGATPTNPFTHPIKAARRG
ncbi:hypothetical protein [Azospirillum rugosum]|uniref:Uncharacterized protein n=1 Tax=Azospirillum rugosum TaxID=416170 RepID=A0ABS4SE94_9PROT|nr:hypothetical protein [Azospirillum rugosum]MBP2290720.1 hypothetical protein [Azospirillum rugosum]MDQ0525609.1 hypothetical protein [Azospirillum rugosum]